MILPKKNKMHFGIPLFPVFQTHSQRFAVQLMRGSLRMTLGRNRLGLPRRWLTVRIGQDRTKVRKNDIPEINLGFNWFNWFNCLNPCLYFVGFPGPEILTRPNQGHGRMERIHHDHFVPLVDSILSWQSKLWWSPAVKGKIHGCLWKGKSEGLGLELQQIGGVWEKWCSMTPWYSHSKPLIWGSASVFRPLITSLRSTPDRMDACPSTKAHQPPIGNDANVHATAIVINRKRIPEIPFEAFQVSLTRRSSIIVDVFLLISFMNIMSLLHSFSSAPIGTWYLMAAVLRHPVGIQHSKAWFVCPWERARPLCCNVGTKKWRKIWSTPKAGIVKVGSSTAF